MKLLIPMLKTLVLLFEVDGPLKINIDKKVPLKLNYYLVICLIEHVLKCKIKKKSLNS